MANLFVINKTLSTTSGATLIQERIYHTSTESDGGYDGLDTNINFESEAYNNRSRPYRGKYAINYIRAIRRF
jgi:hypothetical protein